jgi:hypothetical protein
MDPERLASVVQAVKVNPGFSCLPSPKSLVWTLNPQTLNPNPLFFSLRYVSNRQEFRRSTRQEIETMREPFFRDMGDGEVRKGARDAMHATYPMRKGRSVVESYQQYSLRNGVLYFVSR